jgi:DNA-binding transcriptional MerR regulator
MSEDLIPITVAAERSGLSVATLSRHTAAGVLRPSARGTNGEPMFRETDLARLRQVRHLHPLGLTEGQMHSLVAILDALDDPTRASVRDSLVRRLHEQVRLLRGAGGGARAATVVARDLVVALAESAVRPGGSSRWL